MKNDKQESIKMSREARSRPAGKVFKGKIISLKMQKTAVVEVKRTTIHPMYKKVLRRSKKYKADTGDLILNVGDIVMIKETKPLSKDKNFKVEGVLPAGRQGVK